MRGRIGEGVRGGISGGSERGRIGGGSEKGGERRE